MTGIPPARAGRAAAGLPDLEEMKREKGLSGGSALGLALLLCLAFSLSLLLPRKGVPLGEELRLETRSVPAERVLSGGDEPDRVALELLPGEKLDLNTASAEELQKLPGIGEKLSAAIVAYREEQGAFQSVEELLQVPGIGEKRLAAIRDLVSLGPEG